MAAFPSSGKLYRRVLTSLRMLGIAFTDLRGLRTLNTRNAFMLMPTFTKSAILYVVH